MKNKKILIILFIFIFSLFTPLFGQSNTPAPYTDDEFPQGLKDIRRFEIITLGSLPFVMLDTNLVYSSYIWAKNDFSSQYSPNPFASSNNTYSKEEMTGIILTSLGISVGIGLTDHIINVIKRRKTKRINQSKNPNIEITDYLPVSQDPEAIKIDNNVITDNITGEVEFIAEDALEELE